MLRTYTSSKSGLSARKSESNSGDATISLRMVNKDTSRISRTFFDAKNAYKKSNINSCAVSRLDVDSLTTPSCVTHFMLIVIITER